MNNEKPIDSAGSGGLLFYIYKVREGKLFGQDGMFMNVHVILKSFLLMAACMLMVTSVHAQGSGQDLGNRFTPLSPSVSGLYNAVNFPVSYATGLVDISIPLFEVKHGELSLPISISYRSSGLKVGDPAGLVGMGWSLNAEPVVSRQVKGTPDEGGTGRTGYLQNQNIGLGIQTSNYNYLYSFSKGFVDEEPDDFYYRTLKRSGQFFYSRKSLNNVSLGYDLLSTSIVPVKIKKTVSGFSIIESDGTVYTYPDANAEITSTSSGAYKSAWKVSKIKSITGVDEINFSYYNDLSKEHHFSFTNNITVEEFPANSVGCAVENPSSYCGMSDFDLPSPVIRRYYAGNQSLSFIERSENRLFSPDICSESGAFNSLSETQITTKMLKEINFGHGKLVFEYWKRLDNPGIAGAALPIKDSYMLKRILVYSNSFSLGDVFLNRTIEFYQSGAYWNREVLDSIDIFDSKNVLVERYKFDYNRTILPSYPYAFSDHWGYLNDYSHSPGSGLSGVISDIVNMPFNNCILFPYETNDNGYPADISILIGDHDKNADNTYTSAQMLTRIDYPTGSYTTFVYEPNKWRTASDSIVEGGGMRIKEIKSYSDPNSDPLIRSFRYGQNESGTGFGEDVGINDYVYVKNNTYQTGMLGGIVQSFKRTFMVNPISSYFFPSGTPVVYDQVHEYIGTPSSNVGKSSYKFNYSIYFLYNVRRRYSSSSPMMVDYRNNHLWGELLEKKEYAFGNDYVLKRKEVYAYESLEIPNSSTFARQIYCTAELVGNESIFNQYSSYYNFEDFSYSIYSSKKFLTSEMVLEYLANGDSVTTRRKILYDTTNVHFPRSIIAYDSLGDSVVSKRWYPTDFSGGVFTDMQSLNVIEPVVEEISYQDGTIELSRTRTEYIYVPYLANILKSSISTSYAGEPLTKEIEFTYGYDNKVQESVFRESLMVSYLWWSGFREGPVAEVKNARYDEIAFEAINDDEYYGKLYLPGGASYLFDLGLPIGSYCLYVWNNDKYTINVNMNSAKTYILSFWIKNAAVYTLNSYGSQLQILSDAVINEKGDWEYRQIVFKNATGYLDVLFNTAGCLINGLSLYPIDAQMTNYIYESLVGMTSSTDASGKTIHYEYDDFQRLKNVKDQDGNIIKNHIYHYKP